MDKMTYDFFKTQSFSYEGDLTEFINDLPLLTNQEFKQLPNRTLRLLSTSRKKNISLTVPSIYAYLEVATQFQIPTTNQANAISAVLLNIAYGIIYPEYYPTQASLPANLIRVSLSTTALANLAALDPNTDLYISIPQYFSSLATNNTELFWNKPDHTDIEAPSGYKFRIPSPPATPKRTVQIQLKLPIDYLHNIAIAHNIIAYRSSTPAALAGQVVEYIGLGWLSPSPHGG